MKTNNGSAEIWDDMHQTQRMMLLNKIYLPDGPVDLVACSGCPWDELPDQVQNDLSWTNWA
jgi:hypothetical protein